MNPVEQVRLALVSFGLGDVVLELNGSARTAQMAADAIGLHFNTIIPVGAIVKSLLFVIDDHPTIVLAAGDRIVKEKLIGGVCHVSRKKVKLADAPTVLKMTGYEVGGVPPVGHTQAMPVLIDQSLDRFQRVWAAAGAHHAVFPIEYPKLIEVTRGQVAAITEELRGLQGAET